MRRSASAGTQKENDRQRLGGPGEEFSPRGRNSGPGIMPLIPLWGPADEMADVAKTVDPRRGDVFLSSLMLILILLLLLLEPLPWIQHLTSWALQ